MTTFSSWNNSNGGLFITAHNWKPIGVPNSGSSDAGLPTLSQAYTVTSNLNETLDFLEVDPHATLAITGGTFSMASTANNFSNVYNFGTINVGAATLLLGVSASGDSTEINGPGTVVLLGTGTTPGTIATMQINAPYMGLFGGAQVQVTGNGQILGSTTSLTNFQVKDAIISGGGSIGNGANAPAGDGLSLTVTALGTINANGGHAMVLETGANAISNGGLIETTAAGGLTIDSQMYQNGKLVAAGTGALTINGVEVGGLGKRRDEQRRRDRIAPRTVDGQRPRQHRFGGGGGRNADHNRGRHAWPSRELGRQFRRGGCGERGYQQLRHNICSQ